MLNSSVKILRAITIGVDPEFEPCFASSFIHSRKAKTASTISLAHVPMIRAWSLGFQQQLESTISFWSVSVQKIRKEVGEEENHCTPNMHIPALPRNFTNV